MHQLMPLNNGIAAAIATKADISPLPRTRVGFRRRFPFFCLYVHVMRGSHMKKNTPAAALVAAALAVTISGITPAHEAPGGRGDANAMRNLQPFANSSGLMATYNVNGRIDPRNAFFQPLSTNGRSCDTCHRAAEAFSITPPSIRERFERTRGRDPLFAPVDGANCANAKRSDRADHSLLLGHGLIRVAQTVPVNAQFAISVIHDPFGCALVSDTKTGELVASVYRRPLPTTNISFLSAVMWDGRETLAPLGEGASFLANLRSNLAHQAGSAIKSHGESDTPPTPKQLAEIVDLQLGLFTAQIWDFKAGSLEVNGVRGGARMLGEQIYYPGINDSLGAEPTGLAFTPFSMAMFGGWDRSAPAAGAMTWRGLGALLRERDAARRDIAAGEKLFNSAPLTITAVRGLNDSAALGRPAAIPGTCTTCHDTPNVGHHSLPLPLDIGVGHTAMPGLENDSRIAAALAALDAPNLPVFEISGCATPFSGGQPVSFFTTDPGKALVSGQCADLNRLKGPVLRGLAGRAPYFHNGAAATLMQAVNFYDQRFAMNLTAQQKSQLVAFLNSL
jgi:cytochrome c peroxidase